MIASETSAPEIRIALRAERRRKAKKYIPLYIFCLIPAVFVFIFHYLPIYGLVIAFQDFRVGLGIGGSSWNNFQNFRDFFDHPFFVRILRNTIVISAQRIIFGFPAPVIVALLLNELRNQAFKRTMQSISYLPHFMSWVVIAGIVIELLSPQRGVIGVFYRLVGIEEVPIILTNRRLFRPVLIASGIWHGVGWGTIVYLAAISSIDPELYDVASIDGAGRIRQMVHITVPALVPVMVVLFILRLGRMLNAGFDQIFNLYNPLVYEVADIIDTYVFRVGILEARFGFAAAVGMFKAVIGVILVLITNTIVKKFSEYSLW